MPHPRRTLAAAIAVAALLLAAPAVAGAQASPGCPTGASCGRVTVPLDHSGVTPGTLSIAYSRLPATGTRTGTIVLLSGGPGQSAIPLTSVVGALLEPLRASNDVVLVDQRGTGSSEAVSCGIIASAAQATACANKLGPLRPFLNTTETAEDLEDLRGALGVDKLTLLGVSYGTKVAGEYARRHPASTAAVVLDSPVSVDGLDGVSQLRQLGGPRALKEVCFPGACRETIRDTTTALADAAERLLERERATVRGADGKVEKVDVDQSLLYRLIAASDVDPGLRLGLPAAIASLANGDSAPLLRLAGDRSGTPSADEEGGINEARLLATTCIESHLPWAPESPVATRVDALKSYLGSVSPTAFAPFRAATVLSSSAAALCAAWPPTPRPQGVPSAGPAGVPVLVLSGREDLRTPLEDARRTAAQFPSSTLLAVPGVGHSVLTSDISGCALTGLTAFLSGQPVVPCSQLPQDAATSLIAAIPAAAYLPVSAERLRPTGGARGRAGRTATAVSLTLAGFGSQLLGDVLSGAIPRSGVFYGLRGGSVKVTRSAITLRSVEWFKGVRVTGRVTRRAARLVVSGDAAAPGVLVQRGSRLAGTLDGRAVRLAATPYPSVPDAG